ncbi:hypothetical protein E2C01_091703 [Portunus trituberculatus]|uniref:Uncharacterized protein n=1 Tax=Portunus trituberculatus TaxID=210409 RepID=A0A5B7JPC2_PORTR|nr:hypothetical protein [Portunus trituberculatus]
MAAGAARLGR